jgi:hypothetical protein
LASVSLLYTCLLWGISHDNSQIVVPLTVAASAFHAVEYLAFVTFYATKRRDAGPACLFSALARQWSLLLVVYVLALGIVAYGMSKRWAEVWIGLNLWAALLHYAYDGMIWKLRVPATAKLMGASGT